jgi:hypothetical protein
VSRLASVGMSAGVAMVTVVAGGLVEYGEFNIIRELKGI